MARVKTLTGIKSGTKLDKLFKALDKVGFFVSDVNGAHHKFDYDGEEGVNYGRVKLVITYHKRVGVKNYNRRDVRKAIQDVRDAERLAGIPSTLDEELIDYYLGRYIFMNEQKVIKSRYDMSERKNIFGDRNEFMRNIKHIGSHKGHDIYYFTGINEPGIDQVCCPALNLHDYYDESENFYKSYDAMIENFKDVIEDMIQYVRKHSKGIIRSFVLDKDIRV